MGKQGGSVLHSVLSDDQLRTKYNFRVITRNTQSAAAKDIASNPRVDVVQADMNDIASLSSALDGVYAVFAVTNFWEHMNAELEEQQGKNIIDAAVGAGVRLFIWSGVADIISTSNGSITTAQHFNSKAAIEKYLRATQPRSTNVVCVHLRVYMHTLLDMFVVPTAARPRLRVP
jgi:uncharacterized protein YbjT (DUF2867 family)